MLIKRQKKFFGISAGYGSGGFSYGLNGSYNNTRAREMAKQKTQPNIDTEWTCPNCTAEEQAKAILVSYDGPGNPWEKYKLKNISDPEKYPGIDIYQNQDPSDMTAVTLPGKGIYIGGGFQEDRLTMVTQHEYGHYLQYKRVGMWNFYSKIGLQSLFSYGDHKVFWTETAANRLAVWYFRDQIHPDFTSRYPLWGPNE